MEHEIKFSFAFADDQMFRLAQYAVRVSHQAIKRPLICSKNFSRAYLSDAYQAFEKWDESLSNEVLQKTNISMSKKRHLFDRTKNFCSR